MYESTIIAYVCIKKNVHRRTSQYNVYNTYRYFLMFFSLVYLYTIYAFRKWSKLISSNNFYLTTDYVLELIKYKSQNSLSF